MPCLPAVTRCPAYYDRAESIDYPRPLSAAGARLEAGGTGPSVPRRQLLIFCSREETPYLQWSDIQCCLIPSLSSVLLENSVQGLETGLATD
jgi:hypothetical protein